MYCKYCKGELTWQNATSVSSCLYCTDAKHQQPSALEWLLNCYPIIILVTPSEGSGEPAALQSERHGKCKQLFNVALRSGSVISLCGNGLDRGKQVSWLTVKNNELHVLFPAHVCGLCKRWTLIISLNVLFLPLIIQIMVIKTIIAIIITVMIFASDVSCLRSWLAGWVWK